MTNPRFNVIVTVAGFAPVTVPFCPSEFTNASDFARAVVAAQVWAHTGYVPRLHSIGSTFALNGPGSYACGFKVGRDTIVTASWRVEPSDRAIAPIDAVPAMIVPASRRAAPAAAHAVRRAFNGRHNLITPDVHGFVSIGSRWACELSSGEGFRDRRTGLCPTVWAITVVRFATFTADHALSRVFTTRDSACRYLGKLAYLDAYRRDRAALLAHAKRVRADAAPLYLVRLDGLRQNMVDLRRRYSVTLDRFGCEAPCEMMPLADTLTVGQRHAAARPAMVAQPVQQAQARDARTDLQPGLAIDRACLDCEPAPAMPAPDTMLAVFEGNADMAVHTVCLSYAELTHPDAMTLSAANLTALAHAITTDGIAFLVDVTTPGYWYAVTLADGDTPAKTVEEVFTGRPGAQGDAGDGPTDEQFADAARAMLGDSNGFEVDAGAQVSRGSGKTNGAFVACWVWVSNEEARK